MDLEENLELHNTQYGIYISLLSCNSMFWAILFYRETVSAFTRHDLESLLNDCIPISLFLLSACACTHTHACSGAPAVLEISLEVFFWSHLWIVCHIGNDVFSCVIWLCFHCFFWIWGTARSHTVIGKEIRVLVIWECFYPSVTGGWRLMCGRVHCCDWVSSHSSIFQVFSFVWPLSEVSRILCKVQN